MNSKQASPERALASSAGRLTNSEAPQSYPYPDNAAENRYSTLADSFKGALDAEDESARLG